MAKKRVGSIQRTLQECKRRGWIAGVVERRNPVMKHKTHDFLGIIDVIALGDPECLPCNNIETIGIQATMISGRLAHIEKIMASTNSPVWLKAGNRLQLWSWRKSKIRGKKLHRWVCKEDLFINDGGMTIVHLEVK